MEEWLSGGILSALYLLLRIMLCGFWFGIQPGMHCLERSARMVLFGLLLNLLPALLLGMLGIWYPVVDVLVWLLISLVTACCFIKKQTIHIIPASLPALFLPCVVALFAVLLPAPSEWLAGGWDPGLYQTSAVEIARNHGTQPFERKLFRALSPVDRRMLARDENGFYEVMPGIPIDLQDGRLHHYFFPLTPVYGAWLYRIGGLELLVRSSVIAAFLGAILFGGLAFLLFGSVWSAAVSLGFLMLSPMWWYHQGVPTSELLQLFLLIGIMIEYLRARKTLSGNWLLLLLAFGLTVNRFSAPPFIAILLFFAGIGDAWSGKGQKFSQRWLAVGFGCIIGMLWIVGFYPLTIFRLEEKDAALSIVVWTFVVIYLGAGVCFRFIPKAWAHPIRKVLLIVMLLLGVGSVMMAIPACYNRIMHALSSIPLLFSSMHRYTRLIAYHGIFFWGLVVVGLVITFAQQNRGKTQFLPFVLSGLLAICFLLLVHPGIAPFYPWTLRRYIVYMIPLLALSQSIVMLWACKDWHISRGMRAGKVLVIVFGVLAIMQGGRFSHEAIAASDYDGILDFLDQVESELQPDDIVIADDARWATPLLLVSGYNAFDGGIIWQNRDSEARKVQIEAILYAGEKLGKRVIWMTSTDEGMDLYDQDWITSNMRQIGNNIDFTYPTVIHSSGATVYLSRENEQTFRFWTFR